MMFLEHAVRGMWYPYLANYLNGDVAHHGLGFTDAQSGWVLGFAQALGAVTAPVIVGRLADRYLNAERALAIMHVIAGSLLFLNASSKSFSLFLGIMICFSIAYAPTMSLTTSLALSHLADREKTFPRTRMWGTIGWITTSALFTLVVLRSPDKATNIGRIPMAMRAAGTLAIGYAVYAFFGLPKTPPADHAPGPLLPLGALRLLRNPSVLVLSLVSIPVAATHTAYYLNIGPYLADSVGIPLNFVGPTLAIAQTSEVVCLFILGKLLKRFGYTTILTVGAAAHALRFMAFAINPPPVVVCFALALHGVAFACFFTTATLYIERISPPQIRHSTQTVFGIVLFGIGPALAGPYAQLFDHFAGTARRGAIPNYSTIWWAQAAVAGICATTIATLFRPKVGLGSTAVIADLSDTTIE